jgi:hypothetical protein
MIKKNLGIILFLFLLKNMNSPLLGSAKEEEKEEEVPFSHQLQKYRTFKS